MLNDADTAALDDAANEERDRCAALAEELAHAPAPKPRWGERAVCASRAYPYDMYPEPTDHRGMAIALGACARCPVRLACLAAALDAEGDMPERTRAGISGGTTPRERWIIAGSPKRKTTAPGAKRTGGKRPAPCGTPAALERHRRAGEECEECTAWRAAEDVRIAAATAERLAAARMAAHGLATADCGTLDGYVRHRVGRTAVCDACRLAAQLGKVVWSRRTKSLVPAVRARKEPRS